jgi:hypothetical protein
LAKRVWFGLVWAANFSKQSKLFKDKILSLTSRSQDLLLQKGAGKMKIN